MADGCAGHAGGLYIADRSEVLYVSITTNHSHARTETDGSSRSREATVLPPVGRLTVRTGGGYLDRCGAARKWMLIPGNRIARAVPDVLDLNWPAMTPAPIPIIIEEHYLCGPTAG
jgi:hypothetical protein